MHRALGLDSKATGHSLGVVTHETLNVVQLNDVKLTSFIVLHHSCFRDVHGNVVFPLRAVT